MEDLDRLEKAVEALLSMNAAELRRALAYLNDRFGGNPQLIEEEIDELGGVLTDAHRQGISFAAGAIPLSRHLVEAGYRQARILPGDLG